MKQAENGHTNDNAARRICAVLVDRANYGRMKPIMQAVKDQEGLELQVVAAGTMLLERFGYAANVVEADGFEISGRIYMELEGSVPITMAKSVGFGILEFANEFMRLKPDYVLMIGDRYEALAAAIAAAYMNIPLVHVQGGEVSGSIDESARHAITKFAQFHVPATERAAEYLVRMGERRETVLTIGCPSSDIARMLDRRLPAEIVNSRGSGCEIDPAKPYILALFHPTTTEFGTEAEQMRQLLGALGEVRTQTLLLWPNIDAGSDHVSKVIRVFRDQHETESWLRTRTNFPPDEYLKVLANAACAVGNSSSFVRDAGFFGTPVVLVGNRQRGREADVHAKRIPCEQETIRRTLETQLVHGRYAPSRLYGDGYVSERVAQALLRIQPYIQKQLAFIDEEEPGGDSSRAPHATIAEA